jgi:hypothetical protein
VTNSFSRQSNEIYVYDSTNCAVTHSLILQTSSLLRNHSSATKDDSITFSLRNCCQQTSKTRLCGFYAVAFAIAVCNGIDPTGVIYDERLLVSEVRSRLDTGSVHVIPGVQSSLRNSHCQTVRRRKLYCKCHQASGAINMIQCDECHNWYHVKCVGLSSSKFHILCRPGQSFVCETCDCESLPASSCVIDLTAKADEKDAIAADALPTEEVFEAQVKRSK